MKHGWLNQATSQHYQQEPKPHETTQLSSKGTSQMANYRHLVHLRCIPLPVNAPEGTDLPYMLISANPISHLSYSRASHMAPDNCA